MSYLIKTRINFNLLESSQNPSKMVRNPDLILRNILSKCGFNLKTLRKREIGLKKKLET